MEMTIDDMYDWLYRLKSELVVYMPKEWHEPMRDSIQNAIAFSRKYQMMQADYNARLKADIVAMLEELDLEIDEMGSYNREVAKVQRLIRDKINALKAESEDKE